MAASVATVTKPVIRTGRRGRPAIDWDAIEQAERIERAERELDRAARIRERKADIREAPELFPHARTPGGSQTELRKVAALGRMIVPEARRGRPPGATNLRNRVGPVPDWSVKTWRRKVAALGYVLETRTRGGERFYSIAGSERYRDMDAEFLWWWVSQPSHIRDGAYSTYR